MKRRLLLLAIILIIALLPASALFAYAGAVWQGTVRVTNEGGSSASNTSTVFDLNSPAFIANDFANSTLTNVAMQYGGTDVVFMPGYSTNPWAVFAPLVGAGQNLDYSLYSGGTTSGGKIRYFPGTGGMTTADEDVNFELGNNFIIKQKGYVDTTAGSGKNLVYKWGAFRTNVSAGSTITSTIGLATSLSPYSSTSDGFVRQVNANYNTAWVATTGTVGAGTNSFTIGQYFDGNYFVYRGFFFFDTSTIPDDAFITSATLKLYGSADNSATDFLITIQNGQPPYPTDPLAVGDYNKANYSGDGGSLTTAGFSLAGYNNITLNATGLTWINLTGTTKLALRSSRDIAGTTPAAYESVDVYATEQAGTANDPQLVVNYQTLDGSTSTVSVAGITPVAGEKTVQVINSYELYYDGDDYLANAIADFRNGDSAGAIEVWFRSSSANYQMLFASSDTGTDTSRIWVSIASTTGFLTMGQQNNGDAIDSVRGNTNVADGKWHHAVFVSNSTVWTIILDGNWETLSVNVGANTGDWFADTTLRDNITVGTRSQTTNVNFAIANIGWLRIYNRYMWITEAATNYRNGLSASASNATGLVFNLPLGEGTGNPVDTVGSLTMALSGVGGPTWATNLGITIDNIFDNDNQLAGSTIISVPDNDNNWTFLENDVMPYMEYQEITIGGAQEQYIDWEYGATFQDTGTAGHDHDATPTFRTTSSDADVSASLISFLPVNESKINTFSLYQEMAQIAPPSAPPELYTEGDYSKIPAAEAINEILDRGEIPQSLWWLPFIYFGICIVGLLVYDATRLRGGSGSLLAMCVVIEVLLAVVGIMKAVPLFPAFLFPIPAAAILISQKHYGWG